MNITTVDSIIQKAIKERLFPGAALGIYSQDLGILCKYYGRHTFVPWSRKIDQDSVFDLASVTKPLCTALAVATMMSEDKLQLNQPVTDFFPDAPLDKWNITLRHLLCHSSGLSAWMPIYKSLSKRGKNHLTNAKTRACEIILSTPLAYETGSKSIYSDLGFILLGRIVEISSGLPLWHLVKKRIYEPLGLTSFTSPLPKGGSFSEIMVPTGYCPIRKRICWGEANDINVWSIGGISGHAGLFSNLEDTLRLTIAIMNAYNDKGKGIASIRGRLICKFLDYRSPNPDIQWALGFDRPSLQGSSSGDLFSQNSVGHLGYTGTSFWIDLQEGISVVFLSARTFPRDIPSDKKRMKKFRRSLHNEIRKVLG